MLDDYKSLLIREMTKKIGLYIDKSDFICHYYNQF